MRIRVVKPPTNAWVQLAERHGEFAIRMDAPSEYCSIFNGGQRKPGCSRKPRAGGES